MKAHYALKLLAMLIALSLSACAVDGDDDDEDPEATKVKELHLAQDEIPVTDQTTLRIDLSYSENAVFYGDQSIVVLVHLPPYASYVPDTARIDREGPTTQIVSVEEVCENGDRFVWFGIGREDLTTFDDILSDSATLVIVLRGEQVGAAFAEARAQYNEVVGSCASAMIPDAKVELIVTPVWMAR